MSGCETSRQWLSWSFPVVLLACASRAPHIPAPEPLPDRLQGTLPDQGRPDQTPAEHVQAEVEASLRAPISRAEVLTALSLLQSSMASGQPALEELLAESASLSAPGSDGRRSGATRQTITSALSANFVDPELYYDPLEVTVRPAAQTEVASVPVAGIAGSAARRIVLSIEVGYDDGVLRIQDITLSRAP